jgi:hypothetical protein
MAFCPERNRPKAFHCSQAVMQEDVNLIAIPWAVAVMLWVRCEYSIYVERASVCCPRLRHSSRRKVGSGDLLRQHVAQATAHESEIIDFSSSQENLFSAQPVGIVNNGNARSVPLSVSVNSSMMSVNARFEVRSRSSIQNQ